MPEPIEDEWQRSRRRELPEGFPCEESVDSRTGNRMVSLEVAASDSPTSLRFGFDIERIRAQPALPSDDQPYPEPPSRDSTLARYLSANRMVPVTGPLIEDALVVAAPGDPPLQSARRVYQQLIETFDYDRRGCTPDRMDELGNLAVACDLRTATCTEFHGLFVARMRALGVPARFVFGFNIPRGSSGTVRGYHCWAMIAAPSGRWIPVDVSEAWKQPERRDFYFGALDPDRVAFTWDRDVELVPRQEGEPLDKFIFPYAESQGRPVNLDLTFSFAER